LKIFIEKMIDYNERRVLSELFEILRTLALPTIIVGAGARLLIFDRVFGEGRATKDWDIAVSIDSREAYEQLRQSLIGGKSPHFKSTRILHKFIHIETDIEVDIVPFGKIGEPDQKIEWSDTDNIMNVAGFAEALSRARIETIDDLKIPVIDIPAFVVLKIFAWGDRGDRTKKDLEDLEFILSKYEDDERAYDELMEELATSKIDLLDASVYLLGRDIYKMLQPKTFVELNTVLDKLIERFGDDEVGPLGYRLSILKKGINSLSSSQT
jgi:predicted nucleotidyltransferase